MSAFRFKITTDPALLSGSFELRCEVFVKEKDWIEGADGLYEYDNWDIFSKHLVATNTSKLVVGCTRLIFDSFLGLPYDKVGDLPAHVDRSSLFEVSRLAVREQERGKRSVLLLGLTRLVCRVGLGRGIDHWCAVVDAPVLRLLKMIGFTFIHESEPVYYLGSMSVPVVCRMDVTQRVLYTDRLDIVLADHIEEAYASEGASWAGQ